MSAFTYTEPIVQYKEIPLVFKPTKKGRIDKNTYLDFLANLTTGIPSAIRNTGYLYWVDDKSTFYVFSGGVADIDFVPLATLLSSGLTRQYTMSGVVLTTGNNFIVHNLGTTTYSCEFYVSGRQIMIGYNKGDNVGANPSIAITVDSTAAITVDILFTFSMP